MGFIRFIKVHNYKPMIKSDEAFMIPALIILGLALWLLPLGTGGDTSLSLIIGFPILLWFIYTAYIFILIGSDYHDYRARKN